MNDRMNCTAELVIVLTTKTPEINRSLWGEVGETIKAQKDPQQNKQKTPHSQTAQHSALKINFHFLFHQDLKVLHQSFSCGLELNTGAGGQVHFKYKTYQENN